MELYKSLSKVITSFKNQETISELVKSEYGILLLVLVVGSVLGLVLVSVVTLLTQNPPQKEKNSAFECGFSPFSEPRGEFYVKYFLISIIFLVFDIEIIYFIPWVMVLPIGGLFGYVIFVLITILLTLGFYYEWKKGVIDG